jgi:RNA polymerase sigma-70 factor (ECF subfamily)
MPHEGALGILPHIEAAGLDGDLAIARGIRRGEPWAEEELARRFRPGLAAVARIRAGRDVADDLVQETLVIALGNLRAGRFRGEGPLAAYLARILRRLAARSRPRERWDPIPDDLPAPTECGGDPVSALERSRARRRLAAALGLLSDRHREVLIRHYLEEEPAGEIARTLGVPRGTVLSRLHHARRRLAAALRLTRHDPPP